MKLHLGCGNVILPGFTNVDSVNLPGVDVAWDLSRFPWPFRYNQVKKILARHVLEHLPDTVKVMEEIWRISAPGALIEIHVPYWNASDFVTDPTHVRAFNEHTFDFFDSRNKRCQERPYYSTARFAIIDKTYYVRIRGRYLAIRNWRMRRVLEFVAQFLCNIIQVIVFELEAVK